MEEILDVYRRLYSASYPVVTFDESPYQLEGDIIEPLPAVPGFSKKIDCKYLRNGVVNLFLAFEPLTGRFDVSATERRRKVDWALYMEHLIDDVYPEAEKILLVVDNLNIHNRSSFYKAFPPEKANRLASKVEFHYTPKHGSWLNMAEIGFHILKSQCLNRRIKDIGTLRSEISAWIKERNGVHKTVNWQFTTEDARIKLKRLYPIIDYDK